MSDRFDDLARAMAGPRSRRGVLKMLVGAAGAATAATILKPFRGAAETTGGCASGQTVCGDACCPAGVACVNASTSTCGCAAGQVRCGTGPNSCCDGTCTDPATNCCCAAGTTPCGSTCCAKGVACADKASGTCGCPSGYTSCGRGTNTKCCPAGIACGNAKCQPVSTFTGTNRVAKQCAKITCASCTLGSSDFCGSQGDCATNNIGLGDCPCAQNFDQTACFCYQDDFCDNRTACPNGQSDCPSGETCIHTCCDSPPVCYPPCGTVPKTGSVRPATSGPRGSGR